MMKPTTIFFLSTAVVISNTFLLVGCKTLSSQWQAQEGAVVTQDNDPVANAFIVALWKGTKVTASGEEKTCYHVETALSKKAGHYNIASWNKPHTLSSIRHSSVELIAYKPGYEFVQQTQSAGKSSKTFLDMKKLDKKSREASSKNRLKYLQKLVASTSCDLKGQGRQKLSHLYKKIVTEGKQVVKNESDRMSLKSLQRWTQFVTQR